MTIVIDIINGEQLNSLVEEKIILSLIIKILIIIKILQDNLNFTQCLKNHIINLVSFFDDNI